MKPCSASKPACTDMPPIHPELPLPPDSPWNRIASAARRPQQGPATANLPPPDFTSRVLSRWTELRQNETFQFWFRWSLRAAATGAAVAALVYALPPARTAPPLLAPPSVPIPTLSPP